MKNTRTDGQTETDGQDQTNMPPVISSKLGT